MNDNLNIGKTYLAAVICFVLMSLGGVRSKIGSLGGTLLSQAVIIACSVAYLVHCGERFSERIGLKKPSVTGAILLPVYFISTFFILEFTGVLSQLFTSNVTSGRMNVIADEVPFALGVLVIAVLPAVGEELLFRGVMFYGYRKYGAVTAVLISSVSFALIHGNLNQFCYTLIAGILFALLVEATGSLIPASIVHCLVNLVSVILLYYPSEIVDFLKNLGMEDPGSLIYAGNREQMLQLLKTLAVPAAISAVVCVLILVLLKRRNRQSEEDGIQTAPIAMNISKESVFTWALNSAMLLALSYLVLCELVIRKIV